MSVFAFFLLVLPHCESISAHTQLSLLQQAAIDPSTEALVSYLSQYTTPEGQLAAGMQLLNSDIMDASEQFYNETSFLIEELDQAIELIGDAVITVLDDEIFQRETALEDLRGEIQEALMQLNEATGTCEQYPSCLSCAQDQACVWCSTLGRCVTGDEYGPLNNDCQDFSYRGCPLLPCNQYFSCLQCLTDASCAWCESSGECGLPEDLTCDPAFFVSEEAGATCPITDEQVRASYSTDTPLNVPDTRVDDLQSQLLTLESQAARLRDQINLLETSRAQIIASQNSAESMVLSNDYTFEELQDIAESVEELALAEGEDYAENARREAMTQVMTDTANIVSQNIIDFITDENVRRIAQVAVSLTQNRTQEILAVQQDTLAASAPAS